jgi:hypothetical protein
MTLEVRRIVTGHDEFGKGIVVSDEKSTAVSRGLGPNISLPFPYQIDFAMYGNDVMDLTSAGLRSM